MPIRSEIFCNECNCYIQFTLNDGLDGHHIIICPICRHKHHRFMQNGEIFESKLILESEKIQVFYASKATTTIESTEIDYSKVSTDRFNSIFLYSSWANRE